MKGSLNVGAVAGGAAGALVVVILIVLATALICWKLSYVLPPNVHAEITKHGHALSWVFLHI